MATKISFDLVSPDRLLLSDEADMVTVPGTEGYMGVMAGHAPLVSTLRADLQAAIEAEKNAVLADTPVTTEAAVRSAVHHGWRGIRVPSRLSPISMMVTRGKPISPEKKMIWKAV